MAALTVRELVKVYRGRKVVDRVSLDVESGEVIGFWGPTEPGKTTTLLHDRRDRKTRCGARFLDERTSPRYPMHIRARKGVGYLPQEASVFRKLTVHQNILAILETLPLSTTEQEERADALLEELGIRHLADQRASVLSGGERRRLEISRALGHQPVLYICWMNPLPASTHWR